MMRGAMLLARRAEVSEAARTDSVPGRLDGTEQLKYDVCMRVEIASLAARHPDRPQVKGTETHTDLSESEHERYESCSQHPRFTATVAGIRRSAS